VWEPAYRLWLFAVYGAGIAWAIAGLGVLTVLVSKLTGRAPLALSRFQEAASGAFIIFNASFLAVLIVTGMANWATHYREAFNPGDGGDELSGSTVLCLDGHVAADQCQQAIVTNGTAQRIAVFFSRSPRPGVPEVGEHWADAANIAADGIIQPQAEAAYGIATKPIYLERTVHYVAWDVDTGSIVQKGSLQLGQLAIADWRVTISPPSAPSGP
jgi:hypothetical protein